MCLMTSIAIDPCLSLTYYIPYIPLAHRSLPTQGQLLLLVYPFPFGRLWFCHVPLKVLVLRRPFEVFAFGGFGFLASLCFVEQKAFLELF